MTVLYGLIGVGLGSLLRNQIASIVTGLVWQLVAENVLVATAPTIGRWLPLGAAITLVRSQTISHPLSVPIAAGLLTAYAAAAVVAGIRITTTRDA